jgi:predicted DNA-binding transcriptional regulator YafY
MRADRLLSILLLLQARGRMTAGELSTELEVSERTVYRDIDALSIGGVPVYSERGPKGGFALVDTYRSNLTGLTEREVRALSMLSVPAPLVDLGVSQELRRALLKVAAAIPDFRRADEEKARQCFHLDSSWWRQGEESTPHLQAVHQAVWQNRTLWIAYRPPFAARIERSVAPYGLVAKAGVWFMVCGRNDRVHVHRVSDLLDVRVEDVSFARPAGFNLVEFWEQWCREYETLLSLFTATVRVAPGILPQLPQYFGSQIHTKVAQAGPSDAEGWITVQLTFRSFEDARDRLLGFGGGIEVLEPRALRASVRDYAEQIVGLYRPEPTGVEQRLDGRDVV